MKKKTKLILWLSAVSIIILVTIGLSFIFGFGPPDTHRKVTPAEFDRRFTPAELEADLDFMLETLEEVHPDLYYFTSKAELLSFKARIEQDLVDPMTRLEFYPIVARLAAAVGDGHTYARPPQEEWRDYLDRNGPLFPFDVAKTDEGLQITRAYASASPIRTGDLLLVINGHAADSLFAAFLQETSGEKQSYRQTSVERRFRLLLWLHDIAAPFQITWRAHETGQPRQAEIDGVPDEHIRRQTPGQPEDANRYYSYERLPGDIGYIDFRAMQDLHGFKKFLKETFAEIRQTRVRGLIIDLRKNGGGNTELGEALLSYITDKPYRFSARMEWKVSRQLKQYLRGFIPAWLRWLPLHYLHPMGRKIWMTPEGDVAVWESEPRPRPANPLRYQGPVCFLMGSFTFSSAMKLANAIADFDLATLIGEETGGNPNAFGEVYLFDLPNTRLQVGVSTKQFIRANGDAAYRGGVLPDIEVEQRQEDLRKGVDTVLEFAKSWILQMAKKNAM